MKKVKQLPALLVEIISFLLILLFVYAAVSKIVDIEKFRVQIGQSPLLTHFAGTIAWLIPVIELVASILIVSTKYRLVGLYVSFWLMGTFTSYIIAITSFSEFVPCSCGGLLSTMTWSQHLIFNIAFVLLALIGILAQSNLAKVARKQTMYEIS